MSSAAETTLAAAGHGYVSSEGDSRGNSPRAQKKKKRVQIDAVEVSPRRRGRSAGDGSKNLPAKDFNDSDDGVPSSINGAPSFSKNPPPDSDSGRLRAYSFADAETLLSPSLALAQEKDYRASEWPAPTPRPGGSGGNEEGGASMWQTAFNLCATAMGAGVLSLPYAFAETGFLFGTLLLVVFALAGDVSLHMLLYAANRSGKYTLEGLAEHVAGRWGLLAVKLTLAGLLFTAGVLVLVVIGDQLTVFSAHVANLNIDVSSNHAFYPGEWLPGVRPDVPWYMSRFVLTLVSCFLVFPLCLFERLAALSYTSFAAIICITYLVLVLAVHLITASENGTVLENVVSGEAAPVKWGIGIFEAMPLMNAAFISQFNVLPLYAELKHSKRESFSTIVHICYGGVILGLYALGGLSGYLVFGDSVRNDVLQENPSDASFSVARVAVAGVNLCKFPLVILPMRNLVKLIIFKQNPGAQKAEGDSAPLLTNEWSKVSSSHAGGAAPAHPSLLTRIREKLTASYQAKPRMWHWGVTGAIMAVTFCVALVISSVSKAAAIVGAVPGVALVFLLPSYLFWVTQVEEGNVTWHGRWFAPAFALFGLTVGVSGVYVTIIQW